MANESPTNEEKPKPGFFDGLKTLATQAQSAVQSAQKNRKSGGIQAIPAPRPSINHLIPVRIVEIKTHLPHPDPNNPIVGLGDLASVTFTTDVLNTPPPEPVAGEPPLPPPDPHPNSLTTFYCTQAFVDKHLDKIGANALFLKSPNSNQLHAISGSKPLD